MALNESIKTLGAQRTAKLKALAAAGPVLSGSLARVAVRCGNPACRCARGERHEAWIVCKKVNGRSTSFHVPRALLDDVKAWTQEHKRVKKLLAEISALSERMVRIHVRSQRGAAANRARADRIRSSSPSN